MNNIRFEDLLVAEDANEKLCHQHSEECTKVATWRVEFTWPCHCWPATMFFCEAHAELYFGIPDHGHCDTCEAEGVTFTIKRKGAK